MCSVFWLFWLSCWWLARKTPLRKPDHGKGIVSTKPRPKSAYDFLFSVFFRCFMICLCYPCHTWYIRTPMAQYSLFVLKVPLNTNQLTNRWFVSIRVRVLEFIGLQFDSQLLRCRQRPWQVVHTCAAPLKLRPCGVISNIRDSGQWFRAYHVNSFSDCL